MVEPTKAPPRKIDAEQGRREGSAQHATPTDGEEVQKGTSIAETGAQGQGFGLSSGGGGTGGQLDVAELLLPRVPRDDGGVDQEQLEQPAGRGRHESHLRFVIQRDGRIVDITVEQSSGVEALDFYARRALDADEAAAAAGRLYRTRTGRAPVLRVHSAENTT